MLGRESLLSSPIFTTKPFTPTVTPARSSSQPKRPRSSERRQRIGRQRQKPLNALHRASPAPLEAARRKDSLRERGVCVKSWRLRSRRTKQRSLSRNQPSVVRRPPSVKRGPSGSPFGDPYGQSKHQLG